MLPSGVDQQVVAILGYDGTSAAQRALEYLVPLMRRQRGWVEVVHIVDDGDGDGDPRPDLAERVQRAFRGTGADWRFASRGGELSRELMSLAAELDHIGPQRSVIIVVGRPGAHHSDLGESVLAELIHSSAHPVLMVP
jgi:nucleotide-binding universal stress UspA family protein